MRTQDEWLRGQAWFVCDSDDDTVAHALEPFTGSFDDVAMSSFHSYWPEQGRSVSTGNALVTLWLASASDCAPDDLARAYDTCLDIAIVAGFAPHLGEVRQRFRTMVFRQLAADRQRVPADWLTAVASRIQAASQAPGKARQPAELLRIAGENLPELVGNQPPAADSW